jgi:hypothetical protein
MDITKTLETVKPLRDPAEVRIIELFEAYGLSDKIKSPEDEFLYLRELVAETS